jgi:hypothetical protein
MIQDPKHFTLYCTECFADSSQDCICEKILRHDRDIGIPVIDLTDAECEYLSKFWMNKKEGTV